MFVLFLVLFFILLALYLALKNPNGKFFPTRREKLLRKVGPKAIGTLDSVVLRHYVEINGEKGLTLQAIYAYQIKEKVYKIVLPTDSFKLGLKILEIESQADKEKQIPNKIVLSDGTKLVSRDQITDFLFKKISQNIPTVEVIFDKKRPNLAAVRNWS